MSSKPPPKRRNAAATKSRLLAAAQKSFSEQGYPVVGIREIAAAADVSSTMLLNYFGSKAGLYEAALIEAIGPDALLAFPHEGFGAFIADIFLNMDHVATVPSMVVLSSADPDTREISVRVTKEYVLKQLAEWLGPPDAEVRALQIHLLSIGFIFYTKNLPVLGDDEEAKIKLAHWFGKSIQDIVDQSAEPVDTQQQQ